MLLSEAIERYGEIADGVWVNEARWCVLQPVPTDLNCSNTATGKPLVHIYCNKDIATPLWVALQNVINRGLVQQLKTFDGCLNVREVRGMDSLSTHAYGLGLDFNAASNPLGGPGDMNPELVSCFTDAGFVWGGEFHTRPDPMHFSSSQYGWENP
jgi:hypothetical protein